MESVALMAFIFGEVLFPAVILGSIAYGFRGGSKAVTFIVLGVVTAALFFGNVYLWSGYSIPAAYGSLVIGIIAMIYVVAKKPKN